MINSDNVVRGGLTPKLKDIKTLLSILPFDQTGDQQAYTGDNVGDNLKEFKWNDYEELRVFKVDMNKGDSCKIPNMKYLSIMLVVSGSAKTQEGQHLECHSTWYVMPNQQLTLTAEDDCLILISNPSE